MKEPSLSDQFVRVWAYLTDESFGYDYWAAKQFGASGHVGSKPAVLILCCDVDEQVECLAWLEARKKRFAAEPTETP